MINLSLFYLSLTAVVITLYAGIRFKQYAGTKSLIFFAFALAAAAGLNAALDKPALLPPWLMLGLIYLLEKTCILALFIYIIRFTHSDSWFKPLNLTLLLLEPLVAFIQLIITLAATAASPAADLSASLAILRPWFFENSFFASLLLIVGIFFLARDYNLRAPADRPRFSLLIAGIAAGISLNNLINLPGQIPAPSLMLVSLLIIEAAILLGYTRISRKKYSSIPRDIIVEHMSDGWIILDDANCIIDINASAEKIIGLRSRQLIGQPAEKIFEDWPDLTASLKKPRELQFKGSIKIDDRWKYLNINISPILDSNSSQVGKLITWQDNTEQHQAEETRQQARDEMFILLHSVTSAASRALNLDDFLSESIHQIVYSTKSQAVAVYLAEENEPVSLDSHLNLVAQHGIPLPPGSKMASVSTNIGMVQWVIEHSEPLLIEDVENDPRVPPGMQRLSPLSLILLPMMVEGKLLGIICLARSAGATFSVDELAKLSSVAEEVATFIQSNRQRQLSIALAERQRLVRDLHDSVTQKLHGLVLLAEATQAGIQAGVADMPAKFIVQIAENARQALKEMRLFLFQMQPVDFEREGLVSVLRQRLSAVEGRADINARLTVDDNIVLPMETELALYFITQEALNNVLKHARAKKVDITMKNEKSEFVLTIEDNGCGFNLDEIDKGGIGLRSMKERAQQIDGKLTIVSAPDQGTKITIRVNQRAITEVDK